MKTTESPPLSVEFHVQVNDVTTIHNAWQEAYDALGDAVGIIDVCVWSKGGARAYAGDDGATAYQADPDASVFERWERRRAGEPLDCIGRVP